MSIKKILFVLICSFLFISPISFATSYQSPEALWRAYDLKGQARSVLKFYITDGELRADVVKIILKNGTHCEQCKGNLKNQPFLGMTIIRGLRWKKNKWVNGEVLDTDTGNTYSCNITISRDGKIMYLHAFKGIPLFGRTVNWKREPDNT